MQKVRLIENPLDPTSWESLEVEDVRPFLMARFPEWPEGARIYAGEVGEDHDVTPRSKADVERLGTHPDLTVVIYPGDPVTLIIVAIAIAVIATVALMLFLPAIPDVGNQQTQSPNNSLSQRSNRARPNARIPDIYGQLRSIFDLLAVPYRVYEDHHELEIAFMCIGRGAYEVEDIRDGDTLISDIEGASVAIYGPGTSPNGGDPPEQQIGTAIGDPVFVTRRLNEVNGQVLKAPNDTAVRADEEIQFVDGGVILASGGAIDFTDYFEPGDEIEVGKAGDSGTIADASATFAVGIGVFPDSFRFPEYDPAYDWTPGQNITIMGATFTFESGGAPPPSDGDISGSEYNPNYPINQIP